MSQVTEAIRILADSMRDDYWDYVEEQARHIITTLELDTDPDDYYSKYEMMFDVLDGSLRNTKPRWLSSDTYHYVVMCLTAHRNAGLGVKGLTEGMDSFNQLFYLMAYEALSADIRYRLRLRLDTLEAQRESNVTVPSLSLSQPE